MNTLPYANEIKERERARELFIGEISRHGHECMKYGCIGVIYLDPTFHCIFLDVCIMHGPLPERGKDRESRVIDYGRFLSDTELPAIPDSKPPRETRSRKLSKVLT